MKGVVALSSLDRVKLWHQAFRADLRKLKDMKFYIANCNIEYLIGRVERQDAEIVALKEEIRILRGN